jgi:N-acetylglucosaminyldiphosphoundecaprenol N-acetyl-beta-D-mannosaminyltransferase
MRKLFDKLYKKSAQSFYEILSDNLKNNKKTFVITANPETFMISEKNEDVRKMLLDKETVMVPDGIGVLKAGKKIGYNIEERITGIDIANELLKFGNEQKKSIYLFGSKQEVIDSMKIVIKEQYPNLKLVGTSNGYVTDKDKVFEKIAKAKPDIVLVALGIPLQEMLIYKHLNRFKKGIFVGVGGSFDVMSGMKKRAPKIFIKLNLEWLYRIMKEPKRLKRFYDSNVKFLFRIKKYR